MIKFLATLIIAFALVGCGDGSTSLRIENQSSLKLDSVQARGPGFEAYIGELKPGERTEIKIYPYGEAGVSLSFSTNGQTHKSPISGYFEGGGGYNVSAVVSKDLTVSVDASGGF